VKITSVEKIHEYTGHKDAIFAIQLLTDKQTLYSGSADGLIVKWQLYSINDGISIANVKSPIWSFFVDNQKLIAGTSQGNIHVIDIQSKNEIRNIVAHSGGVFAITKYGNKFLSGGFDGVLNIWDENWSLVQSVKVSEKSLREIFLTPNNSILIACSDNSIYFLNEKFEIVKEIVGHTQSVFGLCFISELNQIISGGRDATLKVWNEDFQLIETINAHMYHIHSISLSPCEKLFATSSMDKTIKIWDTKTKKLLKVIDYERNNSHTNCVNKVLWINSNELISCSDDRRIIQFKIKIDHDTE